MKHLALATLVVSTLIAPAFAQDAGVPAAAPNGVEVREKIVTRVYDVSDIVYGMRNYPFASGIVPPALNEDFQNGRRNAEAGGGAGGGGGGLFGGQGDMEEDSGSVARAEAIEMVVGLLTDVISPDSWKDNGGTTGSVRALGGKLIITQTEGNHGRISQLLKELKGNSKTARTVTVAARWVVVDFVQPGAAGDAKAAPATRPATIDDLAKLPSEFTSQIKCLDGQTVHVASGTAKTAVTDATPIIGAGATGLDLSTELSQAGLVLQVTPQIDPEGKSALVDVHCIFTARRPDGDPIAVETSVATTRPAGANGAAVNESTRPDVTGAIDRRELLTQQLQTSLRLALNRPTIIGGMTLEPAEPNESAERRQLYLVLEVSVETVGE